MSVFKLKFILSFEFLAFLCAVPLSPGIGAKIPFVWIHDVRSGSPADQDGLKIGDAIYRFGTVTHELRNEAL